MLRTERLGSLTYPTRLAHGRSSLISLECTSQLDTTMMGTILQHPQPRTGFTMMHTTSTPTLTDRGNLWCRRNWCLLGIVTFQQTTGHAQYHWRTENGTPLQETTRGRNSNWGANLLERNPTTAPTSQPPTPHMLHGRYFVA